MGGSHVQPHRTRAGPSDGQGRRADVGSGSRRWGRDGEGINRNKAASPVPPASGADGDGRGFARARRTRESLSPSPPVPASRALYSTDWTLPARQKSRRRLGAARNREQRAGGLMTERWSEERMRRRGFGGFGRGHRPRAEDWDWDAGRDEIIRSTKRDATRYFSRFL